MKVVVATVVGGVRSSFERSRGERKLSKLKKCKQEGRGDPNFEHFVITQ